MNAIPVVTDAQRIIPEQNWEFEYATYTPSYSAYFNDSTDINNSTLVSVQVVNMNYIRRWVNYKIIGAAPTESVVEQNKVLYKNCFPGVDALYEVSESKVKETLIISDRAGLDTVTFSVKMSANVTVVPDSRKVIYKDAETDEILWTLEEPFIEDSAGRITNKVFYETSQVEYNGVTYDAVSVVVDDEEFLTTAKYPIYLDPTITTGISNTAQSTTHAIVEDSAGNLLALLATYSTYVRQELWISQDQGETWRRVCYFSDSARSVYGFEGATMYITSDQAVFIPLFYYNASGYCVLTCKKVYYLSQADTNAGTGTTVVTAVFDYVSYHVRGCASGNFMAMDKNNRLWIVYSDAASPASGSFSSVRAKSSVDGGLSWGGSISVVSHNTADRYANQANVFTDGAGDAIAFCTEFYYGSNATYSRSIARANLTTGAMTTHPIDLSGKSGVTTYLEGRYNMRDGVLRILVRHSQSSTINGAPNIISLYISYDYGVTFNNPLTIATDASSNYGGASNTLPIGLICPPGMLDECYVVYRQHVGNNPAGMRMLKVNVTTGAQEILTDIPLDPNGGYVTAVIAEPNKRYIGMMERSVGTSPFSVTYRAIQLGLDVWVKVSNTFKEYVDGWVKVGGAWKQILDIHQKIGGTWKKT